MAENEPRKEDKTLDTPPVDQNESDVLNVASLGYETIERKDGFYITHTLGGNLASDTAYFTRIFIARWPCELLWCAEIHDNAGAVTGTLQVQRQTGTQGVGSGTNLLTTAFALSAATNTVQTRSGAGAWAASRQFKTGDRLALNIASGGIGSLRHFQFTAYMKFLGRGNYR